MISGLTVLPAAGSAETRTSEKQTPKVIVCSRSRQNNEEGAVGLGHPLRGTHKKINRSGGQEWREFMRLKHHSHELKIQQLG